MGKPRGVFGWVALVAGGLCTVCGVVGGVRLLLGLLAGQPDTTPLSFFFAAMSIFGAATIAFGAYRFAARGEAGWAPPMGAATMFLALVALFGSAGSPLLLIAAVLALIATSCTVAPVRRRG